MATSVYLSSATLTAVPATSQELLCVMTQVPALWIPAITEHARLHQSTVTIMMRAQSTLAIKILVV